MSVAAAGSRNASMSITKILKDGTKINLGVWSYHHKNPVKHWIVNTWIKMKVIWFKTRGII